LELEQVALAPLIEEVRSSMAVLAAEKNLELSFEVDPAMGPVTLDRAKLKQVLYNFLSNSIKFTPENGAIAVRVLPERGENIRLEVEDTGIGIAAEELPHLFADFHQIDAGNTKKYPGTGLGLSLSKRIVEAQGGTIGVSSTPNVGSTFWATLPIVVSDESTESVKPLAVELAEPGPEVLVVEADPRQRGWLVQVLREAGYDVQAVATGEAAISLCEQRAFSAITLDLLQPDVSGLEILRRIRSTPLNAMVPVMAVTIASERRASATFVLRDFLVSPAKEMIVASLKRAAVAAGGGPILLVDDDAQALAMKQSILTQLGYHAIGRSNRAEVFATVAETQPAAIMVNPLMPAMTGFELLDELRRMPATRAVPVIAWMSAGFSEAEHQQLRIAAQKLALRNPSDIEAMLEELRPNLAHAAGDSRSQAA
jgi:CheY-like chemotaxis protein